MTSEIRGEDGFVTSAGGIVLQTRYVVFDGWKDFNVTSQVVQPLSFLSVNITPKSAQSVFKLELSLCYAASINTANVVFSATRNGTYIENTQTLSNQTGGISPLLTDRQTFTTSVMDMGIYGYIDAPNTNSSVTYTPTIKTYGDLGVAINRTWQNGDLPDHETGLSTFIVTELSGT